MSDAEDGHLSSDRRQLAAILEATRDVAVRIEAGLDERPVQAPAWDPEPPMLPLSGVGGQAALDAFVARYDRHLSGSAGPRYWGFVTGGVTPAALAGDWLASVYDQNVTQRFDSVAQHVEDEAVAMLCDLLGLPQSFAGSLVSGATTSNLAGLAMARQWVGRQRGIDVAADGLAGPAPVLSGSPHASAAKALAVLGLGRSAIDRVGQLPGREAIDLDDLELRLQRLGGEPAIVIASAGTVNTGDFDDLRAIASLRDRYPFWLHVDGAFGALAATSPAFADRVAGLEHADSLCVDAHKWLNVPYDSAALLTPHRPLQAEVFSSAAAYLGDPGVAPDGVHLTPQNSRRFRALPLWMTLMAYGRQGHREIIERCCSHAADLGRRIDADPGLRLLAPVRLNIVCFTLESEPVTAEAVDDYLTRVNGTGEVLLTATQLDGTPAIRAAFSNWRTTPTDVDRAWAAMRAHLPRRPE
jgi:glutamate/tyrosine decarboxylase-like PLP-dependent enzyme